MEFRELLLKLKIHLGVNTNKELADKLNMSEDGIKNWTRKKAIPKKYLKLLEKKEESNINSINGNNNVGINHGTIHINSINEMDIELCKIIKELPPKRKEYYFYKIKAELLEED